jgi:hypothetical protein
MTASFHIFHALINNNHTIIRIVGYFMLLYQLQLLFSINAFSSDNIYYLHNKWSLNKERKKSKNKRWCWMHHHLCMLQQWKQESGKIAEWYNFTLEFLYFDFILCHYMYYIIHIWIPSYMYVVMQFITELFSYTTLFTSTIDTVLNFVN